MNIKKVAIIGAGNIGMSIAEGLVVSKQFKAGQITLTRRNLNKLRLWKKEGFDITKSNKAAVENAQLILLCVEPKQADAVLDQIKRCFRSGSTYTHFGCLWSDNKTNDRTSGK